MIARCERQLFTSFVSRSESQLPVRPREQALHNVIKRSRSEISSKKYACSIHKRLVYYLTGDFKDKYLKLQYEVSSPRVPYHELLLVQVRNSILFFRSKGFQTGEIESRLSDRLEQFFAQAWPQFFNWPCYMMTSSCYSRQNSSGFFFLVQIRRFVI